MAKLNETRFTRQNDTALLISGITTIAAILIDLQQTFSPHYFDRISPDIENHFGNVPFAMILTHLCIVALTKSKAPLARANLLAFSLAASATIFVESIKANNYELVGDVAFGLGAS